ncbi:MAG: acetyl-CoA synthase subunit gamma [Nitrospirae bacterium]|nr:MAG: acetyl-CoA synthase subunit gamma [Nitrospirota bacterium]
MKELKFISIEKQNDKNVASCCSAVEISAEKPHSISTEWTLSDHWGQIKSRTSAFRMRYSVPPGLYACGEPDKDSDVLVSANYKLSFDILRRSLKGLNAWILVLDTKGINVWCAAGKGAFGTDELVGRIRKVNLDNIVSHNRLIVPQLGAVGVNAGAVRRATRFRVYFGPVCAKDIPAYISSGYKKTEAMGRIRFSMADRLVLTPMEINPAMKKYPLYGLIVLLIFGLKPSSIFFRDAWVGGTPFLLLGLISVFAGALVTPAMLPFIPFRSFAIKGWITGGLAVFLAVQFFGILDNSTNAIFLVVSYLFFPLASSYIALQFTGSTTFTGMSGVRKELKFGVPAYIAASGISLILMLIFKLGEWGII